MNLKEIRNKLHLTQNECCNFLKISLRTYKRYENDSKYRQSYRYTMLCNLLLNYQKRLSFEEKTESRNVAVVGCGYVGLSLACLLSKNNNVIITDIKKEKIDKINQGISPFKDKLIEKKLSKNSMIKAYLSEEKVYINSDIVIIATPTDFDLKNNSFDTSSIESTIDIVRKRNKRALIVVKSTIPLGFTKKMIEKFNYSKILFSPEFLREGHALYDNYYPSRIVVGYEGKNNKNAIFFANLLKRSSHKLDVPILIMKTEEAEAVKLFSNCYLAMRVSFFNELDSYAEISKSDASQIIKGLSLDPRIGDFYNNPSFGYGGYCLSKDTKQLANALLENRNNNIVQAIVKSNESRKEFVANQIINAATEITGKSKDKIIIGVYLLSMKSHSDNNRSSSTLDVVDILTKRGINVLIYDPFSTCSICELDMFLKKCDYFIANRYSKKLSSVRNRLYTRDIFYRD